MLCAYGEVRSETMVLIVNKMYYPELGGVEVVAKVIAENIPFDEKNTVLTFNDRYVLRKDIINNVEIVRLPVFLKRGSIRVSASYKKEFLRLASKSNAVFFNFPSGQPELYGGLYRQIKCKKICMYHADLTGYGMVGWGYCKFFVKRFLDAMDEIIVTSPNMAKTSKILHGYEDKIRVVPLFVDIEHFYPRKPNKREHLLSLFGSGKISKLVMYIGRLSHYKGIEYLVKSLTFLDDSYGLVIIGQGAKERELKGLVKELNLSNRVVFCEHVPYGDLPYYYSSADVFVLPSISRAEAFGLVALEAMACGVPIVTTELGTGTSYYNIDRQTGLVVSPKNSETLAGAIDRICREDWKKVRREILVARASQFSIERFKSSILEVFK
jgi:glycosyltransferase involved in cell wall biosynthesis